MDDQELHALKTTSRRWRNWYSARKEPESQFNETISREIGVHRSLVSRIIHKDLTLMCMKRRPMSWLSRTAQHVFNDQSSYWNNIQMRKLISSGSQMRRYSLFLGRKILRMTACMRQLQQKRDRYPQHACSVHARHLHSLWWFQWECQSWVLLISSLWIRASRWTENTNSPCNSPCVASPAGKPTGEA